jgi:hypothetical protein
MAKWKRLTFLMVVVILLTAWAQTPALSGPLEDGQAAEKQQDFQTALKLWQPLADQGNAEAQYDIGAMYYYGQGVPQDNVQAYMWFSLAVEKAGNKKFMAKDRDAVAETMTPEHLAEAKRLVSEWKPTPAQTSAP